MPTDFLMSYENRDVLAKLKSDLNKNLARNHFFNISLLLPTSEELQPLIKYFENFLSVSLVSFHLKGNNTQSLSLQTECTSYLTSGQTT